MTTLQEQATGTPAAAPQTVQQDQLTTGQIVAILAGGLAAAKTLELLSKLLRPFAIPAAAVRVAFVIGGKPQRHRRANASAYRAPVGASPLRRSARQGITVLRPERTPALNAALAGEDVYQAAWVYASAQRTARALRDAERNGQTPAEALQAAEARERRFYAQHQAAQARRRQVAAQVDVAALRHGVSFIDVATGTATKLVGWHARLDEKTSPECRQANGANFPANRPPAIGWPGAVHPNCRCRPGAPFATARMIDGATRRRAA